MKKILSIILIVVLILAVIPTGTVFAVTSTSGKTGDCTWTLNGTKLTISGHGIMNNYISNNTLPWGKEITEAVIEEGVTNIGAYAFHLCENLQRVTISTATSIGTYAFAGCKRLTDIIMPDSITSIGDSAFIGCNNLSYNQYDNALYLGNIKNPYTVLVKCINTAITTCKINDNSRMIYQNAFFNCSNLKDVIIPDNILCIGNHAFAGCSGIDTINIPDSVTTLGSYAFSGCSSAETLYIGSSLITLPTYVFQNCTGLTTVTVPNNITTIQEFAFAGCNSITNITLPFVGESRTAIGANAAFGYIFGYRTIRAENDDTSVSVGSRLLYQSASRATEFSVLSSEGYLTSYENKEFINGSSSYNTSDWSRPWYTSADGTALVAIGSPQDGEITVYGVIQTYIFAVPTALRSVTITDAEKIETASFNNCIYIKNIVLNNGITYIGDSAFQKCIGLTSITIPDSVTNIGKDAFLNCTEFTSIIIPDSVISIGDWAFCGCTGLTNIAIPKEISISNTAFKNCLHLKDVYFSGTKSEFKKISSCFSENTAIYCGVTYGKIENCIWILDGTELIISGTGDMKNFGLNYDINENKNINNAPWGNSACKVIINTGITSIGEYAFYGCTELTSIIIPESVISIGNWSFDDCASLKTVYYRGTKEQWGKINISNNNSYLIDATTFYNYICDINGHKYDNACDTTCNICGVTRTITHYYKYDWSYNRTQHWHECISCGEKKDIENHSYTNDCDTMCNICGATRAITHQYKTVWSNDGTKHWHECSVCGVKKDTANHTYDNACDTSCNICGATREITHRYKTVWSKDGAQHWHECSICGSKKDIENHTYDNACDTACNVCGYIRSVGPHVYDNDCDTTCNICGATRTITHQYKTVWSKDGTQHWHECSICGDKIDIENHIYDNACDATCNVCGYIRSVGPHVYDNDCDTTCNICGATRTITHQYKTVWSKDSTQHWHECSVCGIKKDVANHNFDKDGVCNTCGYISFVAGDLDGVEGVTDADAVYLLMYTFFPEDYPVDQPVDYNGDGFVTDADAIYLLMYTFFPEDYPI